MHLKPHKFALAGSIIVAVCYLVESLFYMFRPEWCTKMWTHMSYNFNYGPILGSGITWKTLIGGFFGWVLMTYVGLFVFAWLYNKLAK